MTLVLSLQTEGSLWLVADRRLSFGDLPPKDDAIKIAIIDSTDAKAIVSYAGLGATGFGNQPSDWIVRALRGPQRTLEESLGTLAGAMQRQLLPHLRQFEDVRNRQHSFIVPANVGGEARLYTINLSENNGAVQFFAARHTRSRDLGPGNLPPRVFAIGSGSIAVAKYSRTRGRALYGLVRSYNSGKLSARAVSDYLADLCYRSHKETKDGSVGPSCIVVWRNADGWPHKYGDGQLFYNENKLVTANADIPAVAVGLDIVSIGKMLLCVAAENVKRGEPALERFDLDELNEKLSKLPYWPDDKLR